MLVKIVHAKRRDYTLCEPTVNDLLAILFMQSVAVISRILWLYIGSKWAQHIKSVH